MWHPAPVDRRNCPSAKRLKKPPTPLSSRTALALPPADMTAPTSTHLTRPGAAAAVLGLATLIGTCQVDKIIDPPGGILDVEPLTLVDSAPVGSAAPRALTLNIRNRSQGRLSWTATPVNGRWLSLNPAQGQVPEN